MPYRYSDDSDSDDEDCCRRGGPQDVDPQPRIEIYSDSRFKQEGRRESDELPATEEEIPGGRIDRRISDEDFSDGEFHLAQLSDENNEVFEDSYDGSLVGAVGGGSPRTRSYSQYDRRNASPEYGYRHRQAHGSSGSYPRYRSPDPRRGAVGGYVGGYAPQDIGLSDFPHFTSVLESGSWSRHGSSNSRGSYGQDWSPGAGSYGRGAVGGRQAAESEFGSDDFNNVDYGSLMGSGSVGSPRVRSHSQYSPRGAVGGAMRRPTAESEFGSDDFNNVDYGSLMGSGSPGSGSPRFRSHSQYSHRGAVGGARRLPTIESEFGSDDFNNVDYGSLMGSGSPGGGSPRVRSFSQYSHGNAPPRNRPGPGSGSPAGFFINPNPRTPFRDTDDPFLDVFWRTFQPHYDYASSSPSRQAIASGGANLPADSSGLGADNFDSSGLSGLNIAESSGIDGEEYIDESEVDQWRAYARGRRYQSE